VKVYLIRHAKALALGEQGIEQDDDRPLSEEGEVQARQLAQALQRRGVQLQAVLTSSVLRARRTAEILVQEWTGPAPELVLSEKLAPGSCAAKKLGRLLRDLQKDSIAVVGHQPDLGDWAAWLIGSRKAYIDFAKGGAAYIFWESELRKGGGALVWLVDPTWYESGARAPEKTAVAGDDGNEEMTG
jgi:phosphohistidine phosphatase